jgi:signal transduction histidine kinase
MSQRARLIARLRHANQRLALATACEHAWAEQAERQTTELNSLLNSLTEGAIIVDRSHQLVLVNPVARSLLEMPNSGGVTYERDWLSIDLRDRDGRPLKQEDRPLSRVLAGQRFADLEVQLVRRDGSVRIIAFNGSAVRDPLDQVVLAILTFRDVTDLRQLEQLKQDYISLISHDLRTPLTVILGRSQLLARLEDGEPFHAHALAIWKGAHYMSAMIEDLLEVSRLESGRIVLHPEAIDLRALLDEVVLSLVPPNSHSRVQVRAPPSLPTLRVDPKKLERVFVNLIGNALKFSSHEALVEVGIEAADSHVVVAVKDHGPGIPGDALPHLFQKYYQTKAGGAAGGLGLGLYIAQLIVDASGGQIWVESEVGQGSTFWVRLPLAADDRKLAPSPDGHQPAPLKAMAAGARPASRRSDGPVVGSPSQFAGAAVRSTSEDLAGPGAAGRSPG